MRQWARMLVHRKIFSILTSADSGGASSSSQKKLGGSCRMFPGGCKAAGTNVRFTPKSGHRRSANKCPLCAKSRHSAAAAIHWGRLEDVLWNFRRQAVRAGRFQHIVVTFLIAQNWSLSLPATHHCSLPQENEFIADHCIWRLRTCFELWIFYSPRTLNISAYSSDWSDGWISSGSTRW